MRRLCGMPGFGAKLGPMEILLANPRGFCAGVDRAIEIVEIALVRYGAPVYVRHEIVHNRHVVEELHEKGAVFIEDPADVPIGAVLIFSAHGVSPAVRAAAAKRKLHVVDATCPLVTKVHGEAQRMAANDYDIVMIGHKGHVEVEGTMGQAPDRMHLIESAADVAKLEVADSSRLGVVTQTTLSVDDTRDIMKALEDRFPSVHLPRNDDICYATQNRQDAVKTLTESADVVIVVGAPESSNSNRLAELAGRRGARAYMVQVAGEIDPSWLEGATCVGVTSGASAPEVLVARVVERLKEITAEGTNVRSLPEFDEGMVFKLPTSLR